MKQFYRMGLVSIMLALCLAISTGFAADKKQYSTTPPQKILRPITTTTKHFVPTGLSSVGASCL